MLLVISLMLLMLTPSVNLMRVEAQPSPSEETALSLAAYFEEMAVNRSGREFIFHQSLFQVFIGVVSYLCYTFSTLP
ncbi:MAG: hypothetical protein QW797_08070 [Thermoproteota archaeon]